MSVGFRALSASGLALLDDSTPSFVGMGEWAFNLGVSAENPTNFSDPGYPFASDEVPALLAHKCLVGGIYYRPTVYGDKTAPKNLHFSAYRLSSVDPFIVGYRLYPDGNAVPRGDGYGLRLYDGGGEVIYNSAYRPFEVLDIVTPSVLDMRWADYGQTSYPPVVSSITAGWTDYSAVARVNFPTKFGYVWYAASYPLPAGANSVLVNWGNHGVMMAQEPTAIYSTGGDYWEYIEKSEAAYYGVHNGNFVIAVALPPNFADFPVFPDGNLSADYSEVRTRCSLHFSGAIVACKI